MAGFPPFAECAGTTSGTLGGRFNRCGSSPRYSPRHCGVNRSSVAGSLSSRIPQVLCKCNRTDHGRIRRTAPRDPDWNRGPVIREDGGMTAQILDGKATAAAIKSDLTARVAALKEKGVT